MSRRLLLLAASCLLAQSLPAQLSDEQIVQNAFPAALDLGDGVRRSSFVAVDLNRDGHPLLVAAYTVDTAGAIRVLNRSGQVLAAPAIRGMRGFFGSVKALDLDADGTPELLVRFSSGRSPDNPDTWVFRWTAQTLQLISPTVVASEVTSSCLGEVYPIDLAGDGTLALLNEPAYVRREGETVPDGAWSLYAIANGVLKQSPDTFVSVRWFRRGKGAPRTDAIRFTAAPGSAVLRVINGSGGQAVTSARVTLNAEEVVGPAAFKPHAHRVETPVTLKGENTMSVLLDGKPESKVTILISNPQS
jgi:hypothetical protein